MAAETERPIQEELSIPIILADRVIKSTREAESFKPENLDVAHQVHELSRLLRSAARLTATNAGVYDRPIRRVVVDLTKTLHRALAVVQKCRYKKTNVLRHVLSITTATDFKKVSTLLDSSLADIKWFLSLFNQDLDNGTISFSLLPIAINDPNLSFIWSNIALVHMGRAEAANGLASLMRNNERNKKVIVEEKGIPPLLRMVKESKNTYAQIAAACALYNLADDPDRVRVIANAHGVQIVSKALPEVPMCVQVELVNLVLRMSMIDAEVQEEFGKENVTRPLVALLGMDVRLEESKEVNSRKNVLHSLVKMNEDMDKNSKCGSGKGDCSEGSRHFGNIEEKEKEADLVELKSSVKLSCANALWILARGSLLNSRKITETKALLVLAKIIEKEKGELQLNCLLVVMELAVVAETNSDLKRSSFKPNSPAAKAVLDQLLTVISKETGAVLVIPAIKAIGCLAKMFPAREIRILKPLVTQLANTNPAVSAESAESLSKFVCDDNFNRIENSKVIIEFNGVPMLMNLIRIIERGQLHLPALVLLCNLAINVGNSKALEQARALSVLEETARHAVAQNPNLRELFSKALHQLTLFQPGFHIHTHA